MEYLSPDTQAEDGIRPEGSGNQLPPGIVFKTALRGKLVIDPETIIGAEIDGGDAFVIEAEVIGRMAIEYILINGDRIVR